MSVSSPLSLSSLSSARHESSTLQKKGTRMIKPTSTHQVLHKQANQSSQNHTFSFSFAFRPGRTEAALCFYVRSAEANYSPGLLLLCKRQALIYLRFRKGTSILTSITHTLFTSSLPHLSSLHLYSLTLFLCDFLDGRLFVGCNLLSCTVIGSAVSRQ